MKNNSTELVFILDRSGSMKKLEKETIDGFNSMLEKQKKLDGNILVSTVLFDSFSEVIHDRIPIQNVQPLTEKDYQVGGNTALLDAVGGAVRHIRNVHKYARSEDVPEHTIFVITTDGHENASWYYDSDTVKEQIKKQTEKYGWEFLFLGANLDAVETASRLGIRYAANYSHTPQGVYAAHLAASEAIGIVHQNLEIDNVNWQKFIDENELKKGGIQ